MRRSVRRHQDHCFKLDPCATAPARSGSLQLSSCQYRSCTASHPLPMSNVKRKRVFNLYGRPNRQTLEAEKPSHASSENKIVATQLSPTQALLSYPM
jgi:hypothetical protein